MSEQEKKTYSPQDFVKGYEALCNKYKMRIVTKPVYKARDDGTFSLVLHTSVGKLPLQE